MLDFLRSGSKQPKGEMFGQLTIERRVLITPKSTISIPNIAVISSGTIKAPSKLAWTLVLALLAGSIGAFAYSTTRPGFTESAAGVAMVMGALVLGRFFSQTERPCLFISSSDGHTSLFTGQFKTLEEVRRLLSDKINADDESAVYRINFEKGVVQTANVGHGATVGAILAGSSNHVMAGAGSARLGTADTFLQATSSPGAQLGNGHYAAGNGYHADYSQVLPNIVEMQRFYAGRQDTQDIADRLGELEHLMRSGTPTPGSRSRLSQLLGDLSSILGAYPGVVQIFQQAARIAGL
jgi:hypothetical protein